MSALVVSSIQVDATDKDAIIKELDKTQKHSIANVNWKDEFPNQPKVEFQVAHNGTHMFVRYMVQEDEILAKADDDGEVWTDSCCEFFMQPEGTSCYYNLEATCIGNILLGYRKSKDDAIRADGHILGEIKRYASMGNEKFDLKKGDFKWELLLVIPTTAFWQSDIKTFSGLKAKANFYKCGDNLSQPHFVSWNPIDWPQPNFHLTQFFGELSFEK